MFQFSTLDEIFNECLCIRELLIRLGFDPKEIKLAMSEDFRQIGMSLYAQNQEIVFGVTENDKPWQQDEVQLAWIEKVAWLVKEGQKEDFHIHFHNNIWLKSFVVKNAEWIIKQIVDRGIVIPNLPFGGAPMDKGVNRGPWGIA